MTQDNFGQDGVPHLTYYDNLTELSFVYDAEHPDVVAVSYGGYGEAVIDQFELLFEYGTVRDILHTFRKACHAYSRGWIAAKLNRQTSSTPEVAHS